MRRDRQWLEDVVQILDSLEVAIAGHTESDFLADENFRFAVAQRLTVVGEAANRVTAELKGRYPLVPWKQMIGLRNILVHQYFGIHWALVWQTATEDAPPLRVQIAEILLEFAE